MTPFSIEFWQKGGFIMCRIWILAFFSLVFFGCQRSDSLDDILSQTFVHKYGFETTKEEWNARAQEGQVITNLKNGVILTQSFENGKLHGSVTVTFPHSLVVEKAAVYDQGILLKQSFNDANGMPIKEEMYEPDQRTVVTLWDEKGSPLSVEENAGGLLLDGKYYTPEHDLEAFVEAGNGERVKRDRSGLLISREEIAGSVVVKRINYHPNGTIHTISHYQDSELQGPQFKYTATGKPLMELHWKKGILDGEKIVYRNGSKIASIPYLQGQKHGTELHFDDLGNLTSEIEWLHDKKHGTTKLYSDENTETQWFYKGQSVSQEKFENLQFREKLIADKGS